MTNVYDTLVAQLYYLVNDDEAAGDVRYFAELGATTDVMTHADRVDEFLAKSPYARIGAGYPYRYTTVSANAVSIAMMWYLYGVDASFTVSTMMVACDRVYKVA